MMSIIREGMVILLQTAQIAAPGLQLLIKCRMTESIQPCIISLCVKIARKNMITLQTGGSTPSPMHAQIAAPGF